MRYLVAGLGNLGEEYRNTRHNAGFMVLDDIAQRENLTFDVVRYGLVSKLRVKNKLLYFLKPSTFMNESGKAVKYWLNYLQLTPQELLVAVDDIALPLGTVRMRTRGGDGGHNGLTSIIEHLKTESFPRLRIGIGKDFSRGNQVDYVLGEWEASELEILKSKLPHISDMIKNFALEGPDRTMSKYNK